MDGRSNEQYLILDKMEFKIKESFNETTMLVYIDKSQCPVSGSEDHEPFLYQAFSIEMFKAKAVD